MGHKEAPVIHPRKMVLEELHLQSVTHLDIRRSLIDVMKRV
jgi:hypothetical protein